MSIHKSQGQTLERVKVDLAKVFEKGTVYRSLIISLVLTIHVKPGSGQAYVALSRATSLEGLQVLNFNPSKARQSMHLLCILLTLVAQVFVHERVKEWSANLETFSGPIVVEDSDDDDVIEL